MSLQKNRSSFVSYLHRDRHVVLSEMALLGSIFLNPSIWPEVRSRITANDFVSPIHRNIYAALLCMDSEFGCQNLNGNQGSVEPLDVVLVANKLARMKKLTPQTKSHLFDIADFTSTSAAWQFHLQTVKENGVQHRVHVLSDELLTRAAEGESPVELVGNLKGEIEKMQQETLKCDCLPMKSCLIQTYDEIENIRARGGGITGVPTGLYALNLFTSGWQSGDLYILAGRPGMGKSVLGKDFAAAAGVPVSFFSLEMTPSQVVMRHLATISKVPLTRIRTATMNAGEQRRLKVAFNTALDLPIFFHDSPIVSVDDIRAAVAQDVSRYGSKLVIIDYLQLIRPTHSMAESRQQEVSEISRALKLMARDLSVPVICLSQLNRECEKRRDHRPLLSDLRESGALEQDADVIMFIYRDHVYHTHADPHIAELKIAKGRNIQTGTVKLYFSDEYQFFGGLKEEDRSLREVA